MVRASFKPNHLLGDAMKDIIKTWSQTERDSSGKESFIDKLNAMVALARKNSAFSKFVKISRLPQGMEEDDNEEDEAEEPTINRKSRRKTRARYNDTDPEIQIPN